MPTLPRSMTGCVACSAGPGGAHRDRTDDTASDVRPALWRPPMATPQLELAASLAARIRHCMRALRARVPPGAVLVHQLASAPPVSSASLLSKGSSWHCQRRSALAREPFLPSKSARRQAAGSAARPTAPSPRGCCFPPRRPQRPEDGGTTDRAQALRLARSALCGAEGRVAREGPPGCAKAVFHDASPHPLLPRNAWPRHKRRGLLMPALNPQNPNFPFAWRHSLRGGMGCTTSQCSASLPLAMRKRS